LPTLQLDRYQSSHGAFLPSSARAAGTRQGGCGITLSSLLYSSCWVKRRQRAQYRGLRAYERQEKIKRQLRGIVTMFEGLLKDNQTWLYCAMGVLRCVEINGELIMHTDTSSRR
jgi:hypothetical protein